ncbi:hypothetical protein [Streptosporangium vulgare]|uniref:hypothetical protein n=1 Tax=Streptosporangium vulgare TaxID=46190 RepID=UPI0031E169F0
MLLNATGADPALVALGLDSPDPARAVKHAETLLAPVLPRERAPQDASLDAIAAPDGTALFFCDTAWLGDFGAPGDSGAVDAAGAAGAAGAAVPIEAVPGQITHIDHVALTQPWHHFDEAALFYGSVLGLHPQESLELPDPYGLLRSRAMSTTPVSGAGATDEAAEATGAAGAAGAAEQVRMVLNIAQVGAGDTPWQHVALASGDLLSVARRLRAEHPELLLPIPGNYYDDLECRHDVDPELRRLGVLYDRDEHGEFLHMYTVTVGRVFFEIVQRVGGYRGYGAVNAPIRLAAQHAGHPKMGQ